MQTQPKRIFVMKIKNTTAIAAALLIFASSFAFTPVLAGTLVIGEKKKAEVEKSNLPPAAVEEKKQSVTVEKQPVVVEKKKVKEKTANTVEKTLKKGTFTDKAAKLTQCLVAAGYEDNVNFRIRLVEKDIAGIKTVVGMKPQFRDSLLSVPEHKEKINGCILKTGGKV